MLWGPCRAGLSLPKEYRLKLNDEELYVSPVILRDTDWKLNQNSTK